MQKASDIELEEKLLEITNELCQRLDIPDYKPRKIVWRGALRHDRCVFYRNRVSLSTGMKNKLDAEDWRPLIASELIYRKKLRTRVVIGFIASLVAMGAAFALLLTYLPIVFPKVVTVRNRYGVTTTGPEGIYLALAVGPILITLGTVLLSLTFAKMVRLQADNYTEKVLGKDSLLGVLNKIATLDASPEGKVKGRSMRRATLPRLHKRVANLQKREENPETSEEKRS